MNGSDQASFLSLTTRIVSSHLRHNSMSPTDLPTLINTVHAALRAIAAPAPAPEAPEPAIPVRQSVTPDYLVCLEDGKRLKMLKRHLSNAYGMSPEEYRAKWRLPPDYPMVAPNYAAQRSALARSAGFGRRRGGGAVPA